MQKVLKVFENKDVSPILKILRERENLSRGQMARRLKISEAVLFNLENGNTRMSLPVFNDILKYFKLELKSLLEKHCRHLGALNNTEPANLVSLFRKRCQLSQKDLAKQLGYASGAQINHFEKGNRVPSITDLFGLMRICEDNIEGFVLDLTCDTSFSRKFCMDKPIPELSHWEEYWKHFYIGAVRQIMRTEIYNQLSSYTPGYFSKILGITLEQEKQSLRVLEDCGILYWKQHKPEVNPEIKTVVPRGISPQVMTLLKQHWLEFYTNRHFQDPSNGLCSIDVLPMSHEVFTKMTQQIRDLQQEIHKTPITNSDSFSFFIWAAQRIIIK